MAYGLSNDDYVSLHLLTNRYGYTSKFWLMESR